MYNCNLFYFIYITLLFISTYAYTYNNCKYCKGDTCVPCDNSIELGTIIIPNNEGKNVTYITETCSTTSIETDFCSSKNCTTDTECLSNKCFKGHCAFNEANPIVQCQEVRTIHSSLFLQNTKGYKYQCGLPEGDKCKSNKDCSSYNCLKYNKEKRTCGEPDDSGCHSTCGWGEVIIIMFIGPIYIVSSLIFCCLFFCIINKRESKKSKKRFLIIFVVLLAIPWILLMSIDLSVIIKEEADGSMRYIVGIVAVVLISAVIIYAICQIYKNKEK